MRSQLIQRIFSSELSNMLAFPIPFWLWRTRQIIQMITSVSIWSAIFSGTSQAFGYERAEMLVYIILSNFISFIVISSRSIDLASVVHSGDLSSHLLRPVPVLQVYFVRDLIDKAMNLFFSFFEVSIIAFLYSVTIPALSLINIALFIPIVLCSLVMFFFINVLFGTIGFWSPDIWAPRFLFFTFLFFTAGYLFPPDVFPPAVFNAIMYTPFPYLLYFPTQVLQGLLAWSEIVRGGVILLGWTAILGTSSLLIWRHQLKYYGAEGR